MNIKKLSTGIDGLDTLFHGGIQLTNLNQERTNAQKQGLIIALKGTRGCNKTLFAMQLMHGLTCSISNQSFDNLYNAYFISLNKSQCDLSDMYYDIVTMRIINYYCHLWTKIDYEKTQHIQNSFNNIIECLFDKNSQIQTQTETYIENFINRIIYYNPRTNGLHYRRAKSDDLFLRGNYGDSEENMIYVRKCIDNINLEKLNKCIQDIKQQQKLLDFNINNVINIKYKESCDGLYNSNHECQPLTIVQNIINYLSSGTFNNCDCIVIDGFSRLQTNELYNLPYAQIEKLLRKNIKASILVFDERQEAKINADIIIDMRKIEDSEEEYVYHELQISKSVFQSAAFGWHQYKKRDTGIDVFPSIHMLLSKRNYLPYKLLTMHNNILQESYEEYLGSVEYKNLISKDKTKFGIYDYIENKERREYNLLLNLYKAESKNPNELSCKDKMINDLKNILWGKEQINSESIVHGWEDHLPSTAIIGNPNSHKRQMTIAGAFHAAKQQEHTIFVLFDKNEADMRRRMRCPGFYNYRPNCDNNNSDCIKCNSFKGNNCHINKCYSCYKYIHFFQIRMGCISAEEFFNALLKQINYFSDQQPTKKICHIVIDDLQKIDYSFPFLKKTPLFLSTLVTLCRQNYAELKIICDKRANLVGELCSLSDNVISIYKNEDDINNLNIYMERNFGGIHSSGLAKYEILDISKLYYCNDGSLEINKKIVKAIEIGSMKEYWRKTYNIIPQKHSKTKKKDSNIDSKN